MQQRDPPLCPGKSFANFYGPHCIAIGLKADGN